MAQTRPSGYSVLDDPSAIVSQEVVEIDGRGRLHLLPRWTSRISWWNAMSVGNSAVLMVLAEPGLLSIRDLANDGPRINSRYADLLEANDEAALEALRLIQDRYRKLPVDNESRVHLGHAALAHLGLPLGRGIKSVVYVAVFPDRLDILSPTYRNAKLTEGSASLDDLP